MFDLLNSLATARSVVSAIAGFLFIAGFVPYILAVFRDRSKRDGAKPAKASWMIWAALDTILLAGMIAKGALNGQMIGVVIGACTTAALALKFGKPGWTGIDRFCLVGAAIGIAALVFNPVVAIAASCSVIAIGAVPTFISAWEDPSRENLLAWTLFTISRIFALAAVPAWTLADALQPITFTAIEVVMMAILLVRPRMLARA